MHFRSPSDPSQSAAAKAKPRYVYLILKPHGQSFRRQVRLLLSKANLSYEYFISKPHGQSSERPVRPMSRKAKPSQVYTILKKHHLLRVGPKQLCALGHLGCTRAAGTSQLQKKVVGFTSKVFAVQVFPAIKGREVITVFDTDGMGTFFYHAA